MICHFLIAVDRILFFLKSASKLGAFECMLPYSLISFYGHSFILAKHFSVQKL